MGGFFLERVLHYLPLLVPRGQRSHTYDAGKKVDTGATVELSLITRVLISRAHLAAANSRIITEGDQLRFRKSTPFRLPDVQKVGIMFCTSWRRCNVDNGSQRRCRSKCMCVVSHCVLCISIGCEKLEPNIFFVFIRGGKKYENHISKIIFFFFFELIIRKRYVRIEESRDQISFLYFIYRQKKKIDRGSKCVCVYMHLVSKYFSKVDKSGKNMKISMILLVRLVLQVRLVFSERRI